MGKKAIGKYGLWSCAGISCVIEFVITMCFALLAAVCIQNEYLNINGMRYVIPGIHTVSLLLGTVLCFKMTKEWKILAAGCAGGIYFIVFLAIAIAVFNTIGEEIIGGFVACIIGIFLGAVLCNLDKKKASSAKRGKAFR